MRHKSREQYSTAESRKTTNTLLNDSEKHIDRQNKPLEENALLFFFSKLESAPWFS